MEEESCDITAVMHDRKQKQEGFLWNQCGSKSSSVLEKEEESQDLISRQHLEEGKEKVEEVLGRKNNIFPLPN